MRAVLIKQREWVSIKARRRNQNSAGVIITLKDNVANARRYIAARILRDLGVSCIDELIVVVGPSSSPFSPKKEQRTRVRRRSRCHGKVKNGVNAFKTHSRVECVPEHAHISPPSTSPNIFSRSKCRRISSPYFSGKREDFSAKISRSASSFLPLATFESDPRPSDRASKIPTSPFERRSHETRTTIIVDLFAYQ